MQTTLHGVLARWKGKAFPHLAHPMLIRIGIDPLTTVNQPIDPKPPVWLVACSGLISLERAPRREIRASRPRKGPCHTRHAARSETWSPVLPSPLFADLAPLNLVGQTDYVMR